MPWGLDSPVNAALLGAVITLAAVSLIFAFTDGWG